MSNPRVAFLGLGTMGAGMARRLLSSHFPLSVYNRNPEKTLLFAQSGAIVANSPKDAAQHADVVMSMVSDDVASRDVWLGETGALAGAKRGSILIESSTLSVGWVKELAGLAEQAELRFLDAPVTGTRPHASAGELTFLVGGSLTVLESVRPLLSAMSREVIHFGPTGSGAMMKLINNFICGVQAASFAEGLAMVDAVGLERDKAVRILTEGAPGSGVVKRVAAQLGVEDGELNFSVRLMTKDLSYAIREGSEKGLGLRTAKSALEIFKQAVETGLGDKDFSSVTKAFRKIQRS